MAWHTIDGLLFTMLAACIGYWAGARSSTTGAILAALFAGTAPLMKQSFIVAPIALVCIYVACQRQKLIWTSAFSVLPGLIYVLLAPVDLQELVSQLAADSATSLLSPLLGLALAVVQPGGIAALLSALVLASIIRYSGRRHAVGSWVLLPLVAVPVLGAGAISGFTVSGRWAWVSVIVVIVFMLVLSLSWRLQWIGISLLVIAYGVSLSWGAPTPSLLAGSLTVWSISAAMSALFTARQTSSGSDLRSESLPPPSESDGGSKRSSEASGMLQNVLSLVLAVMLVVGVTLHVRMSTNYREPGKFDLTGTALAGGLTGIRMSPQSSQYVNALIECLTAFPATRVAVLPDGAGLYPILGLSNPFHMDWWLRMEMPPDHRVRLNAAVQSLNN